MAPKKGSENDKAPKKSAAVKKGKGKGKEKEKQVRVALQDTTPDANTDPPDKDVDMDSDYDPQAIEIDNDIQPSSSKERTTKGNKRKLRADRVNLGSGVDVGLTADKLKLLRDALERGELYQDAAGNADPIVEVLDTLAHEIKAVAYAVRCEAPAARTTAYNVMKAGQSIEMTKLEALYVRKDIWEKQIEAIKLNGEQNDKRNESYENQILLINAKLALKKMEIDNVDIHEERKKTKDLEEQLRKVTEDLTEAESKLYKLQHNR